MNQLRQELPQVLSFSSLEFVNDETVFIVSNEVVSSVDKHGVWVMGVDQVKKMFPLLKDWLNCFCKGVPSDWMMEPYLNALEKVEVLPDGIV